MLRFLSDVPCGEYCLIEEISLRAGIKRRLMELGIQKDEQLRCVLKAPSGTPILFEIKNTLIALRLELCKHILVRDCKSHDCEQAAV